MDTESERELIERLRARDATALEPLMDRHASWLYRVTANAALLKRRGKRAELEVSLEEQLPTYRTDGHREGDRSFLLADWSETPEEILLTGESRKTLERALDRLPDHYRAIVVLREVEGLDNEEVAKI